MQNNVRVLRRWRFLSKVIFLWRFEDASHTIYYIHNSGWCLDERFYLCPSSKSRFPISTTGGSFGGILDSMLCWASGISSRPRPILYITSSAIQPVRQTQAAKSATGWAPRQINRSSQPYYAVEWSSLETWYDRVIWIWISIILCAHLRHENRNKLIGSHHLGNVIHLEMDWVVCLLTVLLDISLRWSATIHNPSLRETPQIHP